MSEETTPGEAGELRALLAAVLDALTLPYDTDDYEKRIVDRAVWAQTTIKGALEEDPAGIGWNADFLRRKLAAEEAAAGPVRDPQAMVDEPSQVWPAEDNSGDGWDPDDPYGDVAEYERSVE